MGKFNSNCLYVGANGRSPLPLFSVLPPTPITAIWGGRRLFNSILLTVSLNRSSWERKACNTCQITLYF